MSYTLCKKVRDLTPYDPIEGEFDIRLDANESFLPLSPALRSKIAGIAASLDYNRYPDPCARELCARYAAVYGLSPDTLTAGDGSDELISIINSCMLEKSDPILTVSDDFSMYAFYAALSEHPIVVQQKEADFRIDVDRSLELIQEHKIKMMIFSNPCNPTGRGLSREEVRRLVKGTDALIVLDEAYMDFWNESLLPEVEEYDNLIILKTCSKALGLAGLRLGFAVANKTITRAMRAVKSPYNVGLLPQAIASAVLEEPDYLQNCVGQLIASRTQLQAALDSLSEKYPDFLKKVYPSVTNFVLIDSPKAGEIQSALAEEKIAVRKFPGFLRISAGSPAENKRLIKTLERILESLEKGDAAHA